MSQNPGHIKNESEKPDKKESKNMTSKKQSLRKQLIGMQQGFIHSLAKYGEGSKTVTDDNPFAAARHDGIQMSHSEVISSLALIMHDWKGKALREHAEELLQVLKKETEQLSWVETVPYYSDNISQDLTREKAESQRFFFHAAAQELDLILHPEPEPQKPEHYLIEEARACSNSHCFMPAKHYLRGSYYCGIHCECSYQQPEPEAVFTAAISNLNYFPHFNSKYAVYGYVGGQVVMSMGHNSLKKAWSDVSTCKIECDMVCFYDQRNQTVKVTEFKAVAYDGVYTHWKKHSWSFEAAPVSYQCQTFDRVGRLLAEETIQAATLSVCKVKALVWTRKQQQYADVKEYRIIGSDGFYAHKMFYMGRWQQYKQVEFPAGY